MSKTFSSLAIRNYRSYAIGALSSNVGLWMARTAQTWLVLVELTDNDARALGLLATCQFLPMLLLSPISGVLADRFPKHRVMLVTQTLLLINAVLLGFLVTGEVVQLWHVYLLATLDGSWSAMNAPSRQAFVSELVDKEHLSNAIGLNSASFNAARLIGPGLGGLLIAAFGTGPVFFIDAASYLLIIIALLTLRLDELQPRPTAARGRGQFRAGLAYIRQRTDLALLMFVAFMMGTFALNFQLTNALMATDVFGRGAADYGFLGSAMAVGSLTAALAVAGRGKPRLRVLIFAMLGYALCAIGTTFAPNIWVFAAFLVPQGFCAITVTVSCNTLVQMSTSAAMRGRVMSVFLAIQMGGTPIGGPVIGLVGEYLGAQWTVALGGITVAFTLLVFTTVLMRRSHTRLMLERHGWRPSVRLVRVTEDVSNETS